MDAHRAVVREAERMNDDLGALFGRLGTREHPRGRVLVAYRNARRALRSALSEGDGWRRAWAVREIVGQLEREVRATSREYVLEATVLGLDSAANQLDVWGLNPGTMMMAELLRQEQEEAVTAITAQVTAQGQQAVALALSGAEQDLIAGNEQQQGALRPAPVISAATFWLTTLAALGQQRVMELGRARRPGVRWYHQAVAAIDERTTDCCLRVHGQVQPLERPFRLTGTPRYADELPHPPFHWYCRTAEALVPAEYAEDAYTEQMVAAAKAELRARERAGRVEIHPADARSRR